MYPIIAISTVPRVGSMWATNVARRLALAAGLRLTPDRVLKRDEESLEAAAAFLNQPADDLVCVIKVHMALYRKPGLKVIYLQRDLRDRIHSLSRFENRPLDEGLVAEMARAGMAMDSHYATWPSAELLRIDYESIGADGPGQIGRIARFMQLPPVSEADIEAIDAMLSRERVRKKIAAADRIVFGGAVDPASHSLSRITGASGVVRAMDELTGFQSGHVSDYRTGDWRHLWTEEQQRMVDDVIRQVAREFD